MSFERLARELGETARQTGEMAAEINEALHNLGAPAPGDAGTRERAMQRIVIALQAQDRIEQRCQNLAKAVQALAVASPGNSHEQFEEIWSSLNLDELAVAEMSGIAARVESGECELF